MFDRRPGLPCITVHATGAVAEGRGDRVRLRLSCPACGYLSPPVNLPRRLYTPANVHGLAARVADGHRCLRVPW